MATQRNSTSQAIEPSPVMRSRQERRLTFQAIMRSILDRCLYRIATLGFDLIILMGMTLLLVGTILAMGGQVRLFQATVLLPLGIMAVAISIMIRRNPSGWREGSMYLLRDWVPFLLIVFIYENMHDVAGQVMTFDIAGQLQAWDIAIFGIEPTLWAQKIYSPLLTDLFSISYGMYFFLPLVIMFLLSIWKMRYEFRHMALCLTVCFILGFLGYVFLPCSPPRYFIENLYTDPVRLHGLFLFDWLQGKWDGLSVISGGAFPSLHVGISAVALIYAYRFRGMNRICRAIWYVYVPLVVSLWFSTVYLRHHWVMDIVAGLVVAGIAYIGASVMMKIWRGLRRRYELPF